MLRRDSTVPQSVRMWLAATIEQKARGRGVQSRLTRDQQDYIRICYATAFANGCVTAYVTGVLSGT